MTVIRMLGKMFANLSCRYLMRPLKDPVKTQEAVLSKIIRINRNTQFGKVHKFHHITSIPKFQELVLPHNYEYFRPYIDSMTKGESDILVPGKIPHWGITAGSTGNPKLIPITSRGIGFALRGLLRLYFSYIAENPREHSKFLDGTVCFFTANPAVRYINNTPVGFGTGVFSESSQRQIWSPLVRKLFYSPRYMFKIKDLQQRFQQLTREITQKDIRAFVGVTSVVLGFLEIIFKNAQAKNPSLQFLKEIFPNYQLSVLGGENSKFYEQRFFSLIGHKIDIREIYGATEELIGVQLQESPGFTPCCDSCFLEFIPIKSTERLLINEVKESTPYRVIITNYNGLYAYTIGDVIEFISTDPPLFTFSHREGTVNIGSGNMTIQQISNALTRTNEEHNCRIVEYCVIGKYNPKPQFIFVIEFDASRYPVNETEYLNALHRNLMVYNPSYRQLIEELRNMTEPLLWIVKTGTFSELEQHNLKGGTPMGQQKIQHLSTEEKLLRQFTPYLIKEVNLD